MDFAAESQTSGLKLGMDCGLGRVDKGESNGEGSRGEFQLQLQFPLQGSGEWDGFERLRLGVSLGVSSGVIWRFGFVLKGGSRLGNSSMDMVRCSRSWTWVCLGGIGLGRMCGVGRLGKVQQKGYGVGCRRVIYTVWRKGSDSIGDIAVR